MLTVWDYLDGNFWQVWKWAARSLTPAQVAWQPVPEVASIGWNLQHLAEMLDKKNSDDAAMHHRYSSGWSTQIGCSAR